MLKLIDIFRRYRTVYSNYLKVIFQILLKKREVKVIFRDNSVFPKGNYTISRNLSIAFTHLMLEKTNIGFILNNVKVDNMSNEIEFAFMDHDLSIKDGIFNGDIGGVFVQETYSKLHVMDRIVVDIGANIGDTALYFQIKGAKAVYAFEPFPHSFKLLEQNIKRNSIKENIIIKNIACGEHGSLMIDPEYKSDERDELKETIGGVQIESWNLKDIIKFIEKSHTPPFTLKCDCEGCEYSLILGADIEDLQLFSEIMIEYHYGYKDLKDKLENAGFQVNYQKPSKNKNPRHNKIGFLGMLHAIQPSPKDKDVGYNQNNQTLTDEQV